MMVEERNVVRRVAVQHLRTTYGIKTKNWNKNKSASCKSTTTTNSVSKQICCLHYISLKLSSVSLCRTSLSHKFKIEHVPPIVL